MDLDELGAVLGDFFDDKTGTSPSHDELHQAFARTGLAVGDPALSATGPVGKKKRVRAVFTYATDNDPPAGLKLATILVSGLRANGRFSPADPQLLARAKRAFAGVGRHLSDTGHLGPLVFADLEGTELSEALMGYVRRLNAAPDDASLLVGTSKDLDEAAARHVLRERLGAGAHSKSRNFEHTFAQAYITLGLAVPAPAVVDGFRAAANPRHEVQHALFLLAVAVNRLRNDEGTGHGKPLLSNITPAEARLVARSTALTIGLLLDALDPATP